MNWIGFEEWVKKPLQYDSELKTLRVALGLWSELNWCWNHLERCCITALQWLCFCREGKEITMFYIPYAKVWSCGGCTLLYIQVPHSGALSQSSQAHLVTVLGYLCPLVKWGSHFNSSIREIALMLPFFLIINGVFALMGMPSRVGFP